MRAIAAIRLNRDTPAFSRFKQVFALITIFATFRVDSSAALGMTKETQSQFAHRLSPHLSRNRAGEGQKTAGMTTETIQITSSR
jgi:hypothetical protein